MEKEYIFVSCDIVGHSDESNLDAQRKKIAAINAIVSDALAARSAGNVIWASGGDGGHVAFPTDSAMRSAMDLIFALRNWSLRSAVPLRITANLGLAEVIQGAGGGPQLVGHGINFAGRLVPFGGPSRVVVTEGFRRLMRQYQTGEINFHDERVIYLKHFQPERVCLLSATGQFVSTWDASFGLSDSALLQMALNEGRALDVIYHVTRLLEINRSDPVALNALRTLTLKRLRPPVENLTDSLFDLLLDERFGSDFARAGTLVERQLGDTICEFGDVGTTMFLILRGRVGVFFPLNLSQGQSDTNSPRFTMGPGQLVGELAFGLLRRRTATLRCLEDTALLAFSYDELIKSVNETSVRSVLEDALDGKILLRIVENVWNTAACFRGIERTGALADENYPWITLLQHSKLTHVKWNGRASKFVAPELSTEGLCILVSGKLHANEAGRVLDSEEYPVLSAHLPGDVEYQPADYWIRGDVKLLSIRRAGLISLGRERPGVDDEILRHVRDSLMTSRIGDARMDGLIPISGCDNASRSVDLVFVHGLGGDARSTWQAKDQAQYFWPAWLGADFPKIGVWSLGYAASVSKWKEESMPLADRGYTVLEQLYSEGLGERPLIFISHSLGGIVVKQFLRHAVSFGVKRWKAIATMTRGIAFIATPHSGANLANFANFASAILRTNEQVAELERHHPRLRELHGWFLDFQLEHRVVCRTYCEKREVRPDVLGLKLPTGLLVVDETSAEPNIPGERAIPLDEDHISICKPSSRDANLYKSIKRFVQECLG